MAVMRTESSDALSGVQWITAAAFLGALFCTVLGIFKKFRASMMFSNDDPIEPIQEMAVYRPYGGDIYSPSFNLIDEVTDNHHQQSTSQLNTVKKTKQSKQKVETPKKIREETNREENNQFTQENDYSNPSPGPSSPGTSNKKEKKEKKSDGKKKDIKGEGADNNKPKKDKEKDKKEKEEKAKEQKLLKEEKVKREKQEKSVAKMQKEYKNKKEKKKKTKKEDESTQQNITNNAASNEVMSATGSSHIPIQPPSEVSENIMIEPTHIPKNIRSNNTFGTTTVSETVIAAQDPGEFSSSWDLVAEHRQNMQREKKPLNPIANNNLRGYTVPKKEINSMYIPSPNSPRNNFTKEISTYSESEHESDTEA